MTKDTNPNRNAKSQQNHNKMVEYMAKSLDNQGSIVYADHIAWYNGSPNEINGYIPDILVEKNNTLIIFEIETCQTLTDNHTILQLQAFSKRALTYLVIPDLCNNSTRGNFSPVNEVRQKLNSLGLASVRLCTCNPFTGQYNYI